MKAFEKSFLLFFICLFIFATFRKLKIEMLSSFQLGSVLLELKGLTEFSRQKEKKKQKQL